MWLVGQKDEQNESQLQLFRSKVLKRTLSKIHIIQPHFAPLKLFKKDPIKPKFPRIAITLAGCHEINICQGGTTILHQSHPGEAFYFGAGIENGNTNAFPRHVVTIMLKGNETHLNFIQHDGGYKQMTQLDVYQIPQPLSPLGQSLIQALELVQVQSNNLSPEVDIVQALLITILSEMESSKTDMTKSQKTWKLIFGFLQENAHLPLTRELVAKKFGLSPNYLSTLSRQQTGKNYHQLFNQLRINGACHLLQGGMSVKEVSYRCGFEDPNTFNRIFRREMGRSPGKYLQYIIEENIIAQI